MTASRVRYFAYGSNMARRHMARLCPGAKALGPAALDGWRLAINRRGYATILPDPGSVVQGILWSLTPRDLPALDRYEQVAGGLYRRHGVALDGGGTALVYLASDPRQGPPRHGYVEGIIAAAATWAFDPAYVETVLRRLLPKH